MRRIDLLKHSLNIDFDDLSSNEYLTNLLSIAEAQVEQYIGYPLSVKVEEYVVEGNDKDTLPLPHYKINGVNYVKEIDEDGNETDITPELDFINLSLGTIRRKNARFYSDYLYKINYNVGFTTLPSDLDYAIVLVALSLNAQTENTRAGVQRLATPDGTFVYNFDLLNPAIKSILDSYRQKNI